MSYDEERDCKVCDSGHRVNCFGDTDGPWGYVVHESLEKERHPIRVPLLILESIYILKLGSFRYIPYLCGRLEVYGTIYSNLNLKEYRKALCGGAF